MSDRMKYRTLFTRPILRLSRFIGPQSMSRKFQLTQPSPIFGSAIFIQSRLYLVPYGKHTCPVPSISLQFTHYILLIYWGCKQNNSYKCINLFVTSKKPKPRIQSTPASLLSPPFILVYYILFITFKTILKAFKDILQHFKLVNVFLMSRRGLRVDFF